MQANVEDDRSAAEYLQEVRSQLRQGKQRDAYELLQRAAVKYAGDPLLLSYYGFLKARVEGIYRSGIEDCTRAITAFQKKMFRGDVTVEQPLLAVLYLNLGRAYLAAGRKKDAIETWNKGLHVDKENSEIQEEIRLLGIRKIVPIPFLDRSNPLNTFFGRLLRKKPQNPNLP
jgi:tetratricopeptide (TPR) repeat protein